MPPKHSVAAVSIFAKSFSRADAILIAYHNFVSLSSRFVPLRAQRRLIAHDHESLEPLSRHENVAGRCAHAPAK